jgi:hypothetical protein
MLADYEQKLFPFANVHITTFEEFISSQFVNCNSITN